MNEIEENIKTFLLGNQETKKRIDIFIESVRDKCQKGREVSPATSYNLKSWLEGKKSDIKLSTIDSAIAEFNKQEIRNRLINKLKEKKNSYYKFNLIAEELNINKSTISYFINGRDGKKSDLSISVAIKLIEYLKIKPIEPRE